VIRVLAVVGVAVAAAAVLMVERARRTAAEEGRPLAGVLRDAARRLPDDLRTIPDDVREAAREGRIPLDVRPARIDDALVSRRTRARHAGRAGARRA
jgi:hypothetical protein